MLNETTVLLSSWIFKGRPTENDKKADREIQNIQNTQNGAESKLVFIVIAKTL